MAEKQTFERRSGIIAIVGRTNVGKSTLINCLLKEKVSIVSDSVQTTRNLIRAILTEERGQLVFLDTPGLHKAQGELGHRFNRTARNAASGVDLVMIMFDGNKRPASEDKGWMERLSNSPAKIVAVVNKTERQNRYGAEYQQLWDRIAAEKTPPSKRPVWASISARTGKGIPQLMETLFQSVPPGPNLFPKNILTDYPRKLNMADLIREKLIGYMRQELPHVIGIWIESIRETEPCWHIQAFIYVEKDSQKGIVIGHKGHIIKKVRKKAEKEMSEMYETPIKLKIQVKTEKNWRTNPYSLRKMGYD